ASARTPRAGRGCLLLKPESTLVRGTVWAAPRRTGLPGHFQWHVAAGQDTLDESFPAHIGPSSAAAIAALTLANQRVELARAMKPRVGMDADHSRAFAMSDDPFLRLATVGRCRLLARVGEGGMGVVYKGRHQDLDL